MNQGSLEKNTAWQALQTHQETIANQHMREMFSSDDQRAHRFSINFNEIYIDYSKHRINDETLKLLMDLAKAVNLKDKIENLFSGKKINNTEDRAALHTVLRRPQGEKFILDGLDINAIVEKELSRVEAFVDQLHSGKVKGSSGKSINKIINIGIGGSDLGPRLVTDALAAYRLSEDLEMAFVANLDSQEMYGILDDCDPETTLFIVTSKSFTTLETHANAEAARDWLRKNDCHDIEKHFIAVSSNIAATSEFGIPEGRVFQLWDWVGGRYSVWSTVGLPVAIALGMENFKAFHAGAYEMDQHFQNATPEKNIPIILAMLDIWYNNFFSAESLTVVPYDHRLRLLPEFLSQLVMESNGKGVNSNNEKLDCDSSHIVWGSIGTNAQHAYFQMLHQGTRLIPVEFLIPLRSSRKNKNHYKLVANCIAQSKALMLGQENNDEPYRNFPGNRPSTTIMYKDLTPGNLGMLLAMYEHRTFVQAMIWDINPFDQWGVELGKVLAKELISELESGAVNSANHDSSSTALMDHFLKNKAN